MSSIAYSDPRIQKVYTKEEILTMDKSEISFVANLKMEHWVCTLFHTDSILLHIWTSVDRKADYNCPTFGFNMKSFPGVFHYNPCLICQSPEDFLEYLVVNQGLKLTLRHATTRQLFDKVRHSLASNITINELIPDRFIAAMSKYEDFKLAKHFNLDPQLNLEEYYTLLLNNKAAGEAIKKITKNNSEGSSEWDGSGGGSGSSTNEQEGGAENGKGEGEENGIIKPFEDSNDATSKGLTALDNSHWEENEAVDAELRNSIDRAKNGLKAWGNITGKMIDVILAAHQSSVNWRRIIRHFGKSVDSRVHRPTRSRWNRRTGFIDPGYRNEHTSKVLFAVDTSGSISDDAAAEALAVVKEACRNSIVDYVCWDTEIKLVERKLQKTAKNRNQFKIAGRGGTDVQCVFDFADKEEYDGVVIVTDGHFSEPEAPKRLKTKYVWLMEKNNYNKNIKNIIPVGHAYEMEEGGRQIV